MSESTVSKFESHTVSLEVPHYGRGRTVEFSIRADTPEQVIADLTRCAALLESPSIDIERGEDCLDTCIQLSGKPASDGLRAHVADVMARRERRALAADRDRVSRLERQLAELKARVAQQSQ